MTQKQIKKIPEPNPKFIIKCYECIHFYNSSEGPNECLKVTKAVKYGEVGDQIPDWCPLEDYRDPSEKFGDFTLEYFLPMVAALNNKSQYYLIHPTRSSFDPTWYLTIEYGDENGQSIVDHKTLVIPIKIKEILNKLPDKYKVTPWPVSKKWFIVKLK